MRFFLPASSGGDMWIGMLNQDFSYCNNPATCQGLFTWVDGTVADAATAGHVGVGIMTSTKKKKKKR